MKTRRISTVETTNYCFRYADEFVEVDKDLCLYPEDHLLDPFLELLHHVEMVDKEHEELLDEREDLLDQVSDLEADISDFRARESEMEARLANLEEKK